MTVALAMTATGAVWAETGIGDTNPAVCLSYVNESIVPVSVLARAKAIVTDRYAAIGVRIPSGSCQSITAGSATIQIQFVAAAPVRLQPGTLAYSTPYAFNGARVQMIWGRISQINDRPAELLGYVLAHEVGHVLEGVSRHSDEGIMKAHWAVREYADIKMGKFAFASEDAELIHMGIRFRNGCNPPQRDRRAVSESQ
jgi:hypothetical protein